MLKPDAALRKDLSTGKDALQHRHFATIAAILRNIGADTATVEAFADELRATNPRFDRARFLAAVKGA